MKKFSKILILLLLSTFLVLTLVACNKTDGKIDTTFVSGTLDGVKSIGNGNSAMPTDLVPDYSGKISFNTPESKKPHDITIESELEHGSLSPDATSAVGGKTITLSYSSPRVSGETGGRYKIRPGSLCVNGEVITDFQFASSIGSQDIYTTSFNMPEIAVTVTASEYFCYEIEVAEPIDNGRISLDKTDYEYGQPTTITVTVTPDTDFKLKDGGLLWDTNEITKTNGKYTFIVPSNISGKITVYADFVERVYYSVVVSNDIQYGTVRANASRAEEGDMVTLTITPNANCKLKPGTLKYTPNGGYASDLMDTNGVSTFVMPAFDITIDAVFIRRFNIFIDAEIKALFPGHYEIFYSTDNEFYDRGIRAYAITEPSAVWEGDEVTLTINIHDWYECTLYYAYFLKKSENMDDGDSEDPGYVVYNENVSKTSDGNHNVSSVTISAMPAFDLYLHLWLIRDRL